MPRLALGLDFGTESVRALLVDADSGQVAGSGTGRFRHGVMDRRLLEDGPALPPDFALQHPLDYPQAMRAAVTSAILAAGAGASDVIGIGIAATACTALPVTEDREPACVLPEFRREPHAYVKLWKHHGAIAEAAAINQAAVARGEEWIARYGGNTSSEWLIAKMLETHRRAPLVLDRAARYLEASDWIAWRLTGREVGGTCAAGYKGMRLPEGSPSDAFLAAVDPSLPSLLRRLRVRELAPAGTPVGGLVPLEATALGLAPGTPVSAPIIDAHAAVPGCGVTRPGTMVVICGTSGCHMLLADKGVLVPGIQGVVRDGILPGYFGYEAGQAAMGDVFAWYERHALPAEVTEEGRATNLVPLELLAERAGKIPAGGSGLLVLDWWNGNRSILIDPLLSGAVLGLTIHTRPEQLLRGLMEGVAFGTRTILENFVAHGISVGRVVVTGGIAERNPVFLQILADALGRPVEVAAATQATVLGAAILGAVAAGVHPDPSSAATAMTAPPPRIYSPHADESAVLDELFSLYRRVHDTLGRGGGSEVMHRLRELTSRAKEGGRR